MPRRVRNPGSGKPPHNGPAKGAGIGGPAKGAGVGPAKSYTAETRPDAARAAVAATIAENHDQDEQKYRQEQRRVTRERRRAAWQAVDKIVADPSHKDHYAAARDTIEWIDGKAVARQITATVEPSAILDTRPPIEDFLAEWNDQQDAKPTQH